MQIYLSSPEDIIEMEEEYHPETISLTPSKPNTYIINPGLGAQRTILLNKFPPLVVGTPL
jgi:hypothetical protein